MPTKRLVALVTAVLFAFTLTSCGSAQVDLSDYPWELEEYTKTIENLDENITIRFADGTLTADGATVILENAGDEDFHYGHGYHIYLKANGKLYRLPVPENIGWPAELLTVPAHDSVTTDCTWSQIYGSLPAGQYLYVINSFSFEPDSVLNMRSVVDSNPYCVVCEFEIT